MDEEIEGNFWGMHSMPTKLTTRCGELSLSSQELCSNGAIETLEFFTQLIYEICW